MAVFSKRTPLLPALLCVGLMGAVAGCHQTPPSTAGSYEKGTIAAVNQPAGGSVTIKTVGMPTNGWVVVHAAPGGQADLTGSIGHAYVRAGPSSNVTVPLSVPVRSGDQVVAMLHLDTGGAKVFQYADGGLEEHDMPILRDGNPVSATITLN